MISISHRKQLDEHVDIILPFIKNKVDFSQIEELTQIKNLDFQGDFNEKRTLQLPSGRKVHLLGLGGLASKFHLSSQSFYFHFKNKAPSKIQIDLRKLSYHSEQVLLGFQLGQYEIGHYKTNKKEEKTTELIIIASGDYDFESNILLGDSINRIKALVDAPSNIKTPRYLADWASKSSQQYGYKCFLKSKKELQDEGFSALLAVGQGSVHDPVLIQTEYRGDGKDGPTICLVGKGITFDSGGLSIKPSKNLHYMKSDMGGASVVLGTVEAAARLKLSVNLIGLVAAAENAVDANSTRPGDVIHSYSGKTIEIIDTDAEGRLVLADALNYAVKKLKPSTLIDFATLTGSVVGTFAYEAAGLFTNNDDLASELVGIGEYLHERVWRLPMYKEYEEDLHSDVADLRNFSNKPVGGAITAAKFLEVFVEDHINWAHIDIAGVSFGDSEFTKMKSATGFGVRLMIEFLKEL